MHDELAEATETLEAALARAAALALPDDLEPVRQLIDDIRLRRGFLGKTLVVAISGGTGTGKSSLLNALAGAEISPVGPIRPTTDVPVAWIPPEPTRELTALLDSLGVERRIPQPSPSYLAIVDLPDFDSIVTAHHDVVEVLVSRVDVVLWVADPEKYNDRVLHREFIDTYRRYQDQFLFVLNQIDLIADPAEVAHDWEDRLLSDGAVQPVIVSTAADPATGGPVGIDELSGALEVHLDAKKAASVKIAADLLRAVDLLADATGVDPGAGLSFEGLWADARAKAAAALALPGGSTQATRVIGGFVHRLAEAAGPALGWRLRQEFGPERIRAACKTTEGRVPRRQVRTGSYRAGVLLLLGGAGGVAALALLAAGEFLGAAGLVIALVAGAGATQVGVHSRREARSIQARQPVAEEVLDAELGTDLRRVLRPRGELSALLAQLGIEAARVGAA